MEFLFSKQTEISEGDNSGDVIFHLVFGYRKVTAVSVDSQKFQEKSPKTCFFAFLLNFVLHILGSPFHSKGFHSVTGRGGGGVMI